MAWLSGYLYRKSITLSRASGAVTDYQMKLLVGESAGAVGEDVDCGGKVLSTFNDLRFTKSDGTTLLDYWIESISGATPNQLATVWIEFDSIGTGATTFYMYYGKADAVTVSNGTNTFITFDDFERGNDGDAVGGNWTDVVGAQIDTGQKWSGSRSCEIPRAAADGKMSIAHAAGTDTYSIRFRVRVAPITEASQKYLALHGNGSTRFTVAVKDSTEDIEYYTNAWQDSGADCTENTWKLIELNNYDFVAKTTDLWVDDTKIVDNAGHQTTAGNNGSIQFLNTHNAASSSMWVDNFIIRNWRVTEPAWGNWGNEEELPSDTAKFFLLF